jgi:hypothetical protein
MRSRIGCDVCMKTGTIDRAVRPDDVHRSVVIGAAKEIATISIDTTCSCILYHDEIPIDATAACVMHYFESVHL